MCSTAHYLGNINNNNNSNNNRINNKRKIWKYKNDN